MEVKRLTITERFVSRRTDSEGKPLIDLQVGDELELREDGLYFTRCLGELNESYRRRRTPDESIHAPLANQFEFIRRSQVGEVLTMADLGLNPDDFNLCD